MVGMFHRLCDVQGRGRWFYFGRDGGGGIFGGCIDNNYIVDAFSQIPSNFLKPAGKI
jgi:hypothetical protein